MRAIPINLVPFRITLLSSIHIYASASSQIKEIMILMKIMRVQTISHHVILMIDHVKLLIVISRVERNHIPSGS
jgi:hypothetical protein